jgi:SAM-dependent methyltransferase
MSVWADNLSTEAKFWDGWLSDPARAESRNSRIEALGKPSSFVRMVSVSPEETIMIIDVGCGPISTIGNGSISNPVEVVYADALGDEYNAILDKHGFEALPRIRAIRGEDLETTFGRQSFHAVNCANALDHFDDPRLAFINFYEVCKIGGVIHLVSYENEGVREGYSGLHQWNLRADDKGLWLGTKDGPEQNLLDLIGPVSYQWSYRSQDPPVFSCLMVKLDPAGAES